MAILNGKFSIIVLVLLASAALVSASAVPPGAEPWLGECSASCKYVRRRPGKCTNYGGMHVHGLEDCSISIICGA